MIHVLGEGPGRDRGGPGVARRKPRPNEGGRRDPLAGVELARGAEGPALARSGGVGIHAAPAPPDADQAADDEGDFIKMIRNIQVVLWFVGSRSGVKFTLSTSRLVTLTVIASWTWNSQRWRQEEEQELLHPYRLLGLRHLDLEGSMRSITREFSLSRLVAPELGAAANACWRVALPLTVTWVVKCSFIRRVPCFLAKALDELLAQALPCP